MRIPDRLLCSIVLFVSDHYNDIHLIGSPADVGVACGHEASAWIALAPGRHELEGVDLVQLIACCERLGKHLASFYIQEREV